MVSLIPKELFEIQSIRYVIGSNGANIYDLKEKKIIYSNHIPHETAGEILRILKPLDLYTEIYAGGRAYMDRECLDRFRRAGLLERYPEEFAANLYPVEDKLTYISEQGLDIDKINIPFIGDENTVKAARAIQELDGISLTSSGFDNLEINAEGASKAAALQFLLDYLKLSLDDVLAIGDNLNDIEMLQLAGIGVAMGNACRELKKAADDVTADNDHDGVGEAIMKYLS